MTLVLSKRVEGVTVDLEREPSEPESEVGGRDSDLVSAWPRDKGCDAGPAAAGEAALSTLELRSDDGSRNVELPKASSDGTTSTSAGARGANRPGRCADAMRRTRRCSAGGCADSSLPFEAAGELGSFVVREGGRAFSPLMMSSSCG